MLLGERKITKIVRNVEWKPPQQTADEYRLVLGTFQYVPEKMGEKRRQLQNLKPFEKEYKFKALLKANPFTERYTFVTFDWGFIEKDDWGTKNIP